MPFHESFSLSSTLVVMWGGGVGGEGLDSTPSMENQPSIVQAHVFCTVKYACMESSDQVNFC